jgi:hypothetical protein
MISSALKLLAVAGCAAALSACTTDQTADGGPDSHSLTTLAATIWVDPDGCKHWVIDDGAEGYMTPILNLDGTPDCV